MQSQPNGPEDKAFRDLSFFPTLILQQLQKYYKFKKKNHVKFTILNCFRLSVYIDIGLQLFFYWSAGDFTRDGVFPIRETPHMSSN